MEAYIKAISYYLPEIKLDNEQLNVEFPEWSVEKVANKIGISQRHIAGDGETITALRALVNKLNLDESVVFYGMLDESALIEFLHRLDIYVHATLGETMSTAIMQVMSCKLPIIASDVLGVNNMIKNGENGLLVPAKNSSLLSQAMADLIINQAKAANLADNAYEFAKKNYSNQKMLGSYNAIFKDLVLKNNY